jgi:hypothetical protein
MRRLSFLAVALVAGCFTTDLDPTAAGAFACNDEPGGECPDGQSCINGRCESDDPPSIAVQAPEDEQDIGLDDSVPLGGMRTVGMTVTGTLDIVPAGGEHVFGEGHLEVSVDGAAPITVESGAGLVNVDVLVPNTIGPHRITVQAVRNDGVPYDHPGARSNRLFFISDGMTPLVGIKSPAPGDEIPLDATEIEVTAAVKGQFVLQAADPLGTSQVLVGHIHIYYAQQIEGCIVDPECDDDYIATIVAPDMPMGTAGTQVVTLPSSGAGTFPLSVVLRNVNHSLYLHDPDPEVDGDEFPLLDEIEILRR